MLVEHGITVHRLRDVLAYLRSGQGVVPKAAGADFAELVALKNLTQAAESKK